MTKTFEELCRETGTDKIDTADTNRKHNYHLRYPQYLEQYRDKPCKLFEIGVARGKSIKMWEKYLPQAEITGLDIRDLSKQAESERSKIYIGDQRNERLLIKINENRGPFDVIIDDGGHYCKPQQISFNILFPLLKDDGVYVIEDMETSYFRRFRSDYGNPISTIEMLKHAIDVMNSDHIHPDKKDEFLSKFPDYPLDMVDGIHIYKEIAFIFKKPILLPDPFIHHPQ